MPAACTLPPAIRLSTYPCHDICASVLSASGVVVLSLRERVSQSAETIIKGDGRRNNNNSDSYYSGS